MIYVFCADGSEEVEFVTIVDVLRRSGLEVASVALGESSLIEGAHGIAIKADLLLRDVAFENCQMAVLPGGMQGTLQFMKSTSLRAGLLQMRNDKKPVAAICAAPMVLGELAILEGRQATIYPGLEEHLKGAQHVPGNVVRDGDVITSKGPGTAMEFAVAIVEYLKGIETAEELKTALQMGDK